MKRTVSLLVAMLLLPAALLAAGCAPSGPQGGESVPSTESLPGRPDESSAEESSETSEEYVPVMGDYAVSLGKSYTVSVEAAEQYSDAYHAELTNGTSGEVHSYSNSELVGFATRKLEVVIDLKKLQSGIHTFSASYYLANSAGISSSLGFTVACSSDNSAWTELGQLTSDNESLMNSLSYAELKLEEEISARYIRFTVTGNAAWIFLEELTAVAFTELEEAVQYGEAVEEAYRQLGTVAPIKGEGVINTDLPKVCISKGASYTIDGAVSAKYPDTDGKLLTDGTFQTLLEHGCWVGFDGGNDVTVKLDLREHAGDISSIEIVSLAKKSMGIYHPVAFDFVAVDEKGKKTDLGRIYGAPQYEEGYKSFIFSVGKTFSARYLEITLHTVEDAVHFLGEISVYAHRKEAAASVYPPVKLETGATPWKTPSEESVNLVAGKTCQIDMVGAVSKENYANNTPVTSKVMTDGVFSYDHNIHNGLFFKFCQGDGRKIIFDLEHLSAVEKLTISFCDIADWAVHAPPSVSVVLSEDGVHWHRIGEIPVSAAEKPNISRGELNLKNAVKARYVVFSFPVTIWAGVDELQVFGRRSDKNALPTAGYPSVYEESTANKRKEPSEDLLGGAEHLCLMYHSKDCAPYTVADLLPYVAYLDKGMTIKDTMFDSFLFLYTTGQMPSGGSAFGNSTKSDWDWCIEDLFRDGVNLDALEVAAGQVKQTLGLSADFKYNVTMTIYYPGSDMKNFGDVDGDGISDDFTVYENRMKAIRQYVEEIEARFAAENYQNIRLVGYYWWHEAIEQNEDDLKRMLNEISEYLHARDRDFFWIPYHCAPGFSAWRSYGFDIACMQPNYVFKAETPYTNLANNEKYTKLYGMGVEMEIDNACLSDRLFYKKYMEYIALGAETGYMTDTVNMYYQSIGIFGEAARSASYMARSVYDVTYHYIKGDLKNVPDTLEPHTFEAEKNKIFKGELGLDGRALREFKISALPEHGTVAFCDDGSFYYFPEKDFTGEVTFTFVYNEYLSWSEECKITIRVK